MIIYHSEGRLTEVHNLIPCSANAALATTTELGIQIFFNCMFAKPAISRFNILCQHVHAISQCILIIACVIHSPSLSSQQRYKSWFSKE